MKIEGPRGVQYTGPVSRTKKTGSTSSTGGFDALVSTESTAGTSAAADTSPVMSVDQLLGIQEVDDALTGKKKGVAYASDILDRLDALRLQILDGSISKEQLMRLAAAVSARRAHTTDPHLLGLLDEIDLRAQVEIAKFTRDIASSGASASAATRGY